MLTGASFNLDANLLTDDKFCWINSDDDVASVIGSVTTLQLAPTCTLLLKPTHLKMARIVLVQWDGTMHAMAEAGGFYEIELVVCDVDETADTATTADADAEDTKKTRSVFVDTRCKLEDGTHYLLDYDSSFDKLRMVVNMGILGRYATSEWFEFDAAVHEKCMSTASQKKPCIVEL